MEAKLYRALCRFIMQVAHPRRRGVIFNDHAIVLTLLWAVLNDATISWACDPQNWPKDLLEWELPSGSTMSRRLRSVSVLQLLERILSKLSDLFPETLVKEIDSKPLVVGHYSGDRDARRGRAAGAMARGYKLHVLTKNGIVTRWLLASMNVNDQVPAAQLLPQLSGGGYVAADNGYDSNPLHEKATAANHQLVAPPRKSNQHVRDHRRNLPQRIRALEMCDNTLSCCGVQQWFGGDLSTHRVTLERTFSQLCFDGMYAPPPWVRRPRRVARWVAGKLIIRLYKLAKKARLTT